MEPAAIGFHTHRIEEVGTRALISTTEDLRKPGFGVYGDKTVGTSSPSPQLVFDNIKVSGTSWDYKPTKYWDRTAAYRFVAYAPWAESGTSYDAAIKQLTINGIPQWKKIDGSEKDYLVATSAETAEHYLSQPTNGTVNLKFKHIYAQLLISVAKTMSSGATTYKITGMRMASGVTDDIPTAQTCTYQYDAKTASNCKITSTRTFTNSFSFLDNLSDADDVTVSAEATPLAHFLVAPF
ncbi:MAG: fimbrillin family protein, partial [Bacteroidaceae bacterium]|nr:fimbrillin family protein [Bacteroidaceae bacterium]